MRSVSNTFASRALPACLTECYNLFTLTLPTFNVLACRFSPSNCRRVRDEQGEGERWEKGWVCGIVAETSSLNARRMRRGAGLQDAGESTPTGGHRSRLCSRQHSRIVAGTLGLLETSVNSCGRSLAWRTSSCARGVPSSTCNMCIRTKLYFLSLTARTPFARR